MSSIDELINNEKLINKIQDSFDDERNEDLSELTFSKIKNIKNDVLQKLQLDKETLKDYHKKLKNYRYIDEINELKYGNFIRSINLNKETLEEIKLNNGGFLVDIKPTNDGIILTLRNRRNMIYSLKMNENLIFQKLNEQEEIILTILSSKLIN